MIKTDLSTPCWFCDDNLPFDKFIDYAHLKSAACLKCNFGVLFDVIKKHIIRRSFSYNDTRYNTQYSPIIGDNLGIKLIISAFDTYYTHRKWHYGDFTIVNDDYESVINCIERYEKLMNFT